MNVTVVHMSCQSFFRKGLKVNEKTASIRSQGASRPTIYDVAKRAGVSKSLVSLVLRGSPNVSAERRAAVDAAIAELNYRPSRAAAALAGSRTGTIGVIIDDYRNLWFVDFLHGIQEVLAEHGIRVAVADRSFNAHVDASPLEGFLAMRVDGIVVASEPSPEMGDGIGVPSVLAGNRLRRIPGADVVASDDRRGGKLAADHLLGLGHRKIGHVTGGGGSARERAAGFIDALREAGVEPVVLGDAGTSEQDGFHFTKMLFRANPETTAVFAANDSMAMGAAAAIRDLGLRVPEDISLLGYDNSPLASSNLLRLTTVDALNLEVGRQAALALLARFDAAEQEAATSLVEPRLVVRGSTARVAD
jgi:DNA-binding LacI/PurR family transcriptional regulator